MEVFTTPLGLAVDLIKFQSLNRSIVFQDSLESVEACLRCRLVLEPFLELRHRGLRISGMRQAQPPTVLFGMFLSLVPNHILLEFRLDGIAASPRPVFITFAKTI